MYKGVVSFEADVRRGVGIHFPQVVFRPPVSGVEKVEVEAIIDEAGRNTIKTSVYLDTTPTQAEGVATAVRIPGGTYTIGSPARRLLADRLAMPEHKVTLRRTRRPRRQLRVRPAD